MLKPSVLVVLSFFLTTTLATVLHAESKLPTDIPVTATSPVGMPPAPMNLPPIPPEFFAWGSGSPASSNKAFKEMDKNSDQKISFDETISYQKVQKEQRKKEEFEVILKSCDKDKDGIISDNEFSAEKNMLEMLERRMPTEAELANDMPNNICMLPPFAREVMDFNEDGLLTTDEVKRALMSDRPPTPKSKQKMENKMQLMRAKQKSGKFGKCDINQDQLLSLREAVSSQCHIVMFTEEFDAHDSNADRYLSIEEATKSIKSVTRESDRLPPEVLKGMPPIARLDMHLHECDENNNEQLDKHETLSTRCHVEPIFFDKVDHNQDAAIDQDEIQRMHAKENFDRNDKNKDGYLDKSEFKAEMIW